MAGASGQTKRVDYVSANWTPGAAGGSGAFELQVVTEDGERTALAVRPDEVAAVVAMTQGSDVLLFDPETATLIVANLAGEWFQSSWTAGQPRVAGAPHGRRSADPDPAHRAG